MATIFRFILFFLLAPAFAIVAQAAGVVQDDFRIVDTVLKAESVILENVDDAIFKYDTSGALLHHRSSINGEDDLNEYEELETSGAVEPLFSFLAEIVAEKTLPGPTFGSSLADVSKSVFKQGRLPDNFITKAEARALGWNPRAGNLADVAPGKTIGGDVFRNSEGLLPNAPGRVWREADLNYNGGFRGSERLLYSNDGLIYRTGNHYKTFEQIGSR